MCGRFVQKVERKAVQDQFGVSDPIPTDWQPRYNLAPGQPAALIVEGAHGPRLDAAVWGLIPAWTKAAQPAAPKPINARVETVWSKPSFRNPLRYRRCLIPANGFYEWQRTGLKGNATKQPFFFYLPDTPYLALAGLWDVWNDGAGGEVFTFAIITRPANGAMQRFHDRMPLILQGTEMRAWLDHKLFSPSDLSPLLASGDVNLQHYPVSAQVNRVTCDIPSCMERIAVAEQMTWI